MKNVAQLRNMFMPNRFSEVSDLARDPDDPTTMLEYHVIYWKHSLDDQVNQVFLDGIYTTKIVTEVLNDLQGDVVAFHTSPNPGNFTEFVAVWTVVCENAKQRRITGKTLKQKVLTASGESATMTLVKE